MQYCSPLRMACSTLMNYDPSQHDACVLLNNSQAFIMQTLWLILVILSQYDAWVMMYDASNKSWQIHRKGYTHVASQQRTALCGHQRVKAICVIQASSNKCYTVSLQGVLLQDITTQRTVGHLYYTRTLSL